MRTATSARFGLCLRREGASRGIDVVLAVGAGTQKRSPRSISLSMCAAMPGRNEIRLTTYIRGLRGRAQLATQNQVHSA